MHQPEQSQPPPPPPKKSIGARPNGFKNLYPNKKPATVTQQLTKYIDFRQNYVCDCHLWILFTVMYMEIGRAKMEE
jgi:hypothetical protein